VDANARDYAVRVRAKNPQPEIDRLTLTLWEIGVDYSRARVAGGDAEVVRIAGTAFTFRRGALVRVAAE
jgi:hypothetical protein